jgi:hypothetical protein
VQNPEHFARVRDEIRRKLETDNQVNGCPGDFRQIQQATSQHVIQDSFGRIPLEGDGDNLRLVPGCPQSISQAFG